MFTVITIMFAGMTCGFILHRRRLLKISKIILVLIWALLFLLGIEVGGNEQIIQALPSLGLEALLITLAALLGSVIGAWALWYKLYRGPRKANAPHIQDEKPANTNQSDRESSPLKGSLIIVTFFVIGCITSYLKLVPTCLPDLSHYSIYALWGLMFCVGFSIGNDPQTLRNFRSLNPRLMLLPLITICGSLLGCLLISPVLSHCSLTDSLAVGSGFGYYSLSSIFITQYKGAELGTLALLSNIAREIIALVGSPLLVKCFGRLAPISAGGATTMDTTLPIITRCSGQEFVILSIFHGFIVDFSVPFLVTFFCSL